MPFWRERTGTVPPSAGGVLTDEDPTDRDLAVGDDLEIVEGGRSELIDKIGSARPPSVVPRFPFSSLEERAEIRTTFRIPLTLPATAILGDGTALEVTTLDLSVGGASFVTSAAIGRDAPITLTVAPGGTTLTLAAMVCHVRAHAGDRTVVGIRFLGLTPTEELTLNRAVAAQDRRLGIRAQFTTGIQYRVIDETPAFRRSTTSDMCLAGMCFSVVPSVGLGDRIEVLIYLDSKACKVTGTVFDLDRENRRAALCFDEPTTPAERTTATHIRSYLQEYRSLAD